MTHMCYFVSVAFILSVHSDQVRVICSTAFGMSFAGLTRQRGSNKLNFCQAYVRAHGTLAHWLCRKRTTRSGLDVSANRRPFRCVGVCLFVWDFLWHEKKCNAKRDTVFPYFFGNVCEKPTTKHLFTLDLSISLTPRRTPFSFVSCSSFAPMRLLYDKLNETAFGLCVCILSIFRSNCGYATVYTKMEGIKMLFARAITVCRRRTVCHLDVDQQNRLVLSCMCHTMSHIQVKIKTIFLHVPPYPNKLNTLYTSMHVV